MDRCTKTLCTRELREEEGQQEATLNVVLGWIASVTLGKMFWKL